MPKLKNSNETFWVFSNTVRSPTDRALKVIYGRSRQRYQIIK